MACFVFSYKSLLTAHRASCLTALSDYAGTTDHFLYTFQTSVKNITLLYSTRSEGAFHIPHLDRVKFLIFSQAVSVMQYLFSQFMHSCIPFQLWLVFLTPCATISKKPRCAAHVAAFFFLIELCVFVFQILFTKGYKGHCL